MIVIKTNLCDLLNIEYPIIQGGMAWVADAELAAAVSNAGGLGLISAMNSNADWLRAEIRKCKTLTNKPFGVNIMLMSPYVDDVAVVVAQEHVAVVTTGAGSLPARHMPMWLEAGIKVIPVVPSVANAKLAERGGAFAVVAEGGESGGHVGDLTTMTLVPQICDAISLPVIAAGGIADGRGVAASLMLGACGVQVGTRFLVAYECTIEHMYKEKILAARDIDTIVTGRRLGHPVRSLKSPFTKMYSKCEYDSSISNEEMEKMGAGALRKAAREGDYQNGCFMAGQSAGMVKKEQSAADIIKEMMSEAEEIIIKVKNTVIKNNQE